MGIRTLAYLTTLTLGLFSLGIGALNTTTFTLSDVDLAISSFLQSIQNGSLNTRGVSSKSQLPSGCALVVSTLLMDPQAKQANEVNANS